MEQWVRDKILPVLTVALIVGLANMYIDVQMMKRIQAQQEKTLESYRTELTDLWSQASDQVQSMERKK